MRAAALLSAGAYAVHELRYLVGYGGSAPHAQAEQGHAYLQVLGPITGGVLAVTFGWFLAGLARPPADRRPAQLGALGRPWLASSVALLVIYVVQELLEGALASGHPAGIAGVLGTGGWSAAAFALAVGALIALLLRGADAAVVWSAARRRMRLPRANSAAQWAQRGLPAPPVASPNSPLRPRAPPPGLVR